MKNENVYYLFIGTAVGASTISFVAYILKDFPFIDEGIGFLISLICLIIFREKLIKFISKFNKKRKLSKSTKHE